MKLKNIKIVDLAMVMQKNKLIVILLLFLIIIFSGFGFLSFKSRTSITDVVSSTSSVRSPSEVVNQLQQIQDKQEDISDLIRDIRDVRNNKNKLNIEINNLEKDKNKLENKIKETEQLLEKSILEIEEINEDILEVKIKVESSSTSNIPGSKNQINSQNIDSKTSTDTKSDSLENSQSTIENQDLEQGDKIILDDIQTQNSLQNIRLKELDSLNGILSNLEESRVNLLKNLEDDKLALDSINISLAEKNAELEALEKQIESLGIDLAKKEEEKEEENEYFIDSIVSISITYSIYTMLIVTFWFLYRAFTRFVNKNVKDENFKSSFILGGRIIWIITSAIIVIYAVNGEVSIIFTLLGIISAAIAFSIRGFVGSFFGFISLSTAKFCQLGDVIKAGGPFDHKIGKVYKIGRFFTFMKELDPDTYEITGQQLIVPNDYLVSNPILKISTESDEMQMQKIVFLIENQEDINKVEYIVCQVTQDRFDWVRRQLSEYLDLSRKIDVKDLEPKIHVSIKEGGFEFMVTFMCRYNKSIELKGLMTKDILKAFIENDIKLKF